MNSDLGTVIENGRILRCGYTTGTCAAAGAKAAAEMLLKQVLLDTVEIELSDNKRITLALNNKHLDRNKASCAVIKDGGDDVDVTDGLYVYTTVVYTDEAGIRITGGTGVGTVTKEGLAVPVGRPAINPVPYQMIEKNVSETCERLGFDLTQRGLLIEISIPGGEDLYKKTLNPKLGIVNGLSVLGTTGVVRPMSKEALIRSIDLELSVLKAEGNMNGETVCLVPGNYGESYAKSLGIKRGIVKISNFLGNILESACEKQFRKILLIGDMGKLVKVSAGIFQTHSRVCDARAEILAANVAALGAETSVVREILDMNTTVSGIKIIEKHGLGDVYQILADKAKRRCEEFLHDTVRVEVIIFTDRDRELVRTKGADSLIEELREL